MSWHITYKFETFDPKKADRLKAEGAKVVSIQEHLEQLNHRTKLANELERYNLWRRGAEDIEQPNPAKLGILIDETVKELRK